MRNASVVQTTKTIFFLGVGLLMILTSTSLAQENEELGRMWTFENPPLAYLEREYGFKPDQKWLDSLRLGSLRLVGEDFRSNIGSASFVSSNGLMLTSNRCVLDAVALTLDKAGYTREDDPPSILHAGFVAASQKQEIRLRWRGHSDPWLKAVQLIKTSNVTGKVNQGVLPTDNEIQARQKRESNKEAILGAARKAEPELVPQIVSLYQGAVVQLYQYKMYDDVRLVVLPHLQTAHFGGDQDNLTYPRYCLDFAFLRAYEDGKPANTTLHHFSWTSGGTEKGDPVFVSGNPGTTSRLFTKAQLELERDLRIPMDIERFTNACRISREHMTHHWQTMLTSLLRMESNLKAARGKLQGLEDATLMAQRAATEKAFENRVMANEELAKRYGGLWDQMARVARERRLLEARSRFHSAGRLGMVDMAITIVRSCDPAETEERRRQAREEVEGWGDSGAGIPNGQSRAVIADHVARARTWLPEDDPYFTKVLGGRSGEAFLEAVIGPGNAGHLGGPKIRTLVHYPEQRIALIESGWKAIKESEDPAIVAARELVLLIRQNEELDDVLDAREEALGAELGRALLAGYGTEVAPDGTGTPRFTDGVVRGYSSNGTIVPHRTTFYGLYARNAEFDDEYPFNLPEIWLDRKDTIDMTKTINFASTNDISVGSSGSVVVNKDLEVVGVVVHGNIESLHNDFVFKDDVPRAVSVHVDGIMEALVKIYDARRIVKELIGATKHKVTPIPFRIDRLSSDQSRVIQEGNAADASLNYIKTRPVLFQIVETGNNASERRGPGRIDQSVDVLIYGLGESKDGVLVDYGWLENVETGERIWEMTSANTVYAGGNPRNRKLATRNTLRPGVYRLHYVSNETHSYPAWKGQGPEREKLYGITMFNMTALPGIEKRLKDAGVPPMATSLEHPIGRSPS